MGRRVYPPEQVRNAVMMWDFIVRYQSLNETIAEWAGENLIENERLTAHTMDDGSVEIFDTPRKDSNA